MSQLVKTKPQGNFKDFNRFGAFKVLVEQKNVFNSFVCKLGFFGTSGSVSFALNKLLLINYLEIFRIPPPPGGTAILPEYIHYYG
jgi:hypothetical protein